MLKAIIDISCVAGLFYWLLNLGNKYEDIDTAVMHKYTDLDEFEERLS